MREVVEVYRGIEICRARHAWSEDAHERYEAILHDWLLIGNLSSVKEQIDRRLDRKGSRPNTPLTSDVQQ
jgi:hypothetical protein